jgi:hypothetical protein
VDQLERYRVVLVGVHWIGAVAVTLVFLAAQNLGHTAYWAPGAGMKGFVLALLGSWPYLLSLWWCRGRVITHLGALAMFAGVLACAAAASCAVFLMSPEVAKSFVLSGLWNVLQAGVLWHGLQRFTVEAESS